MLRHADDITLSHLVELRKLQVDVEILREENDLYRSALVLIANFIHPEKMGEAMQKAARAALKETE